jgi:hypothetical protein
MHMPNCLLHPSMLLLRGKGKVVLACIITKGHFAEEFLQ